ncbi:TPA: hypothetical protein ACRNW4_003273 [Pseudomonas aeruginosa]|uniref:hypothetical protein n=1 Tax=Pseudomonas aeruginosa TaxID=287 RepID=UPI0003B9463E|nr:hypothetical protein [Pseudomonas aeruginosa]ERY41888.1 hypothetical protein Q066_01571 [Pseudomonas aeruginosa BL12]MBG4241867.1 hypothetical protein [Pseudomonas aeruginosa]MBI8135584.1 hypothetical protein [Pseudomonas aeruginosa]MBI8476203.1 hypothetical protein [Pseudomonas aeruginosa]MBI8665549.1 hypothetical protein [Pseudomonas aeruginosa]
MLYPYKRPRHPMRAMHGFITYIFDKVWCCAPNEEYSLELFKGFPNLYAVMYELHRADLAGEEKGAGAFFYRYVNKIFKEFKSLSSEELKFYRKAFRDNNHIQALCEGRKEPVRYIAGAQSPLMDTVEAFFSKLYSCGFFSLKVVKEHIGADLQKHYSDFAYLNKMPCCPFCGLLPMDSEYDPTREAYDHYLPSSKYPFNSVNLRNLAPSCYKCNSQNKGPKDPLHDEAGNRSKAFYPYSSDGYQVKVSMHFKSAARLPAEEEEIYIDLSCAGYEEEIATWDRLYKIRKRYVAKCLSSSGAKYWLQRVLDENKNYKQVSQDALSKELKQFESFPWHESNFLKMAFFDACQEVALIDVLVDNSKVDQDCSRV